MGKDKLTGLDYLTRPMLELQSHPDYSPHAYRVVHRITTMTTKELENVVLIGGGKR